MQPYICLKSCIQDTERISKLSKEKQPIFFKGQNICTSINKDIQMANMHSTSLSYGNTNLNYSEIPLCTHFNELKMLRIDLSKC